MLIVKPSSCEMEFSGPTTVDLMDYIVAVDIQRASDAIDGRTFGKPRRSRMGGGMDTLTLALLWSDAMYAALSAHEYEEGELTVVPATGGDPITATVKFGKVPVGTWAVDQKVEIDLVCSILSGIGVA